MTDQSASVESAGDSPPGHVAVFGILDLCCSLLRLVLAGFHALGLALWAGTRPAGAISGITLAGALVDLLLGLSGTMAGLLLLKKSQRTVPLGRLTIFLSALALPLAMLSTVDAFATFNTSMSATPAATDRLLVRSVLSLASFLGRIVLLGIYITVVKDFAAWIRQRQGNPHLRAGSAEPSR